MSVFAVIFTDEDKEACAKAATVLREKCDHQQYQLVPDCAYLVRHEGFTSDVAESVGIKSDPRIAKGVVFKLNHAYSGFTARTLWEWLGD